MKLLLVGLCGLLLAAGVTPAHATVIYHFAAGGLLDGTISLDNGALFTTSTDSEGFVSGFTDSPLNAIRGIYGGLDFSGHARLVIVNGDFADTPFGQWIIRGTELVGDAPISALNLFVNVGAGSVAISLTPPRVCCTPSFEFQYNVVFPDGSFTGGLLTDIRVLAVTPAPVPEPPTLLFVALASVAVIFARWRRSPRAHRART